MTVFNVTCGATVEDEGLICGLHPLHVLDNTSHLDVESGIPFLALSTGNTFRVEENADTIDVVWGNQVILALPPRYADQIIPGLTEAYLNHQGLETVAISASDLQEGDRLPGLNITVEYTLWFGLSNAEVGVWSDGRCVLTFRDPDHKIKVERKIQ